MAAAAGLGVAASLLAAEQAALDPSQRQPLLDEAPVVWLFQYQSIFGVSSRCDYTVPGTGEMYAWHLKPRGAA